MPGRHLEREDRFDVEPSYVVPDLTSLLPRGARIDFRAGKLRSSYFDTAGHDLLRAHMRLRRRTGATDTGWQLKIAHNRAREEILLPGRSATVPEELQRLLQGVTRGQSLRQIATVATERAAHRILDAEGNLLAEIDDDNVEAVTDGAGATILRWREIAVEPGNADDPDHRDYRGALGKRLRKAGAVRATSTSKLARVLSAVGPSKKGSSDRRAALPVLAYIAKQQQALLAGDLALRRNRDDVIHKTRVATRRLRSTLRTFSELFEEQPAAALDSELKWFAGLLGSVRDLQVQRRRLNRLIDDLPADSVLGPVRSRIDTELRHAQAEAWAHLQAELTRPRYLALLESLAAWIARPQLTAVAEEQQSVLARMVDTAVAKVSRRLTRATDSRDVDQLHSARKAAKRARYAAELTEPFTGGKAAHNLATRYKDLQDLLGEHQDSLVSADLLRRLGAQAGTTPGENGFTFGLLYQRVRNDAEVLRDRANREAAKYSLTGR